MSTELSETLASEISEKHRQTLSAIYAAKETSQAALTSAADCGLLLEKVVEQHKGFAKEWLRQHVPTLPVEQAKVYLGLCKVRRERGSNLVDTRQLKLLGITGDEDREEGSSHTAQRAGGNRWVKWLGHTVHEFREMDKVRPIETWSEFERAAARDQILETVRIYKRLGGTWDSV
jgi:hypothetical protein